VALSWWRNEFIMDAGSYDDLPQGSGHASTFTYAAPPMPSAAPHYVLPQATSADL
jgi:hypothetical protein